jgi:hypothetical protein
VVELPPGSSQVSTEHVRKLQDQIE